MKAESITEAVENLKDKPYAVPIYSLTVVAVSLLLVLGRMDLCLVNIIIAILAVLIPYKFYKEKNIKKVFYAGALALLLVAFVGTGYHLNVIYSQENIIIESEHMEGELEPLYGDTTTLFEGTVRVDESIDVNQVFINLTFQSTVDPFEEEIKSYRLEYLPEEGIYQNSSIITDQEIMFNHYFSMNYSVENETVWEETERSFGPVTLSKGNAFASILLLRMVSPFISFGLIIGLLWWLKRMRSSRDVGKEELKKKDSELDYYCETCGKDLTAEDEVCPGCGELIEE